MKEVKTPRKPFIFYYIVVLLILMLINMFVMPTIREASIKKVDYNEFMNMTLNKQIKKVGSLVKYIIFSRYYLT